MAQDDLLQRHAGAEAQRPRAESADGPRRHLQHPRPVVVHPQLGVDRALAQAEGRAGGRGDRLDAPLDVGRQPRGRDVDRLLEVRALERVRLVEQRQRVERAAHEQAFQRDLDARHVRLGQQELRGVAAHLDVLAGEQRGDPPESGHELVGGVGADDAAAGRQRQGLQHAGKLHAARGQERIVLQREPPVARDRHAGGGQTLAHLELVAGGRHRGRRAGPQAQPLGDGGGGDRGEVVHAHDGAERAAGGQRRHPGGGAVGIGEVEREEMVRGVRLEGARLVGGADDVDAERASGLEEILGAVRRRRQEQEQPVHRRALPRASAAG